MVSGVYLLSQLFYARRHRSEILHFSHRDVFMCVSYHMIRPINSQYIHQQHVRERPSAYVVIHVTTDKQPRLGMAFVQAAPSA
jgi:hypothetical protein